MAKLIDNIYKEMDNRYRVLRQELERKFKEVAYNHDKDKIEALSKERDEIYKKASAIDTQISELRVYCFQDKNRKKIESSFPEYGKIKKLLALKDSLNINLLKAEAEGKTKAFLLRIIKEIEKI
jgi:hypothetical protein